VLPWEDPAEYRDLVASLVVEHAPYGPSEEHLVEELAGILWRKRRLRLAEAAAHRHGLEEAVSQSHHTAKRAVVHVNATDGSEDLEEAVRATAADTLDAVRDMQKDEAMTREALELLDSRRNDPYEAAVETLRKDTQGWWADTLARDPAGLEEDEEPFTADAEGLRRFLEGEVLPWFEARKKELGNPLADPRAGVWRGLARGMRPPISYRVRARRRSRILLARILIGTAALFPLSTNRPPPSRASRTTSS
jgi:hypothetical protein